MNAQHDVVFLEEPRLQELAPILTGDTAIEDYLPCWKANTPISVGRAAPIVVSIGGRINADVPECRNLHHRQSLASNPRVAMMVRTWDRMKDQKRKELLAQAEQYRSELNSL